MNDCDLIRHMCEKSGQSLRRVSVKMGKAPTYLSSTVTRGGGVGASTLADIARACGYTLQVDGHGEIIAVDGREDGAGDSGAI